MQSWWQDKFEENKRFLERFKSWEGKTEYKRVLYNKLIKLNCKSILNCGCGTGKDFITFKNLFEKNDIKVIGIEYSDFMVKDAQKNGLPVIKGDIKKISYDDNNFDASIAIDVFEHINNIFVVLTEMIRVSKKHVIVNFFKCPIEENTTLILNVHHQNTDMKQEKTLNVNQLYITENPGYRNGFTKDCFYNYHNKNLIEKELLNNDKVENYNWYYTENLNFLDENKKNIKEYKNCYLLINLKNIL